MAKQRIGIYAGVFDPVHSGHISFALQALEEAKLREVYFLPERKPLYKPGAEHYGHRVAMLRQACKPYEKLALAEVVEREFSIKKTVLRLEQTFADATLAWLMGADVFVRIPEWKDIDTFIKRAEFVIAVRSDEELKAVMATIARLHIPSKSVRIVDSLRPEVSSTKMRYAIRRNKYVDGLLLSVAKYAKREWLYASVRQNV